MKKQLNEHFYSRSSKDKMMFKKILGYILGNTPAQRFFRYYFFFILIGALLLFSPWALSQFSLDHGRANVFSDIFGRNEYASGHYSFWDALFTACSAFSDTGLNTVATRGTYSLFGQIIIMLLIQFGGFGAMTMRILIWKLLRREFDLKNQILLQAERGRSKLGGTTNMIFKSAIIMLIAEGIGTTFLSINFFVANNNIKDFNDHFGVAFFAAMFMAISAINNAGFDVIGGSSAVPLHGDYLAQLILLSLLVLGGIGFPIVYEISLKIKGWFTKNKHNYSLFAKISLWMYFIVMFTGLATNFLAESLIPGGILTHTWSGANGVAVNKTCTTVTPGCNPNDVSDTVFYTPFQRGFAIFFNSLSCRSAGFASIPMSNFTEFTRVIFSILMIIGCSPSSTGGGIRTTTLAVCFLFVWSKIRGHKQIRAGKKAISHDVAITALLAFFISLFIVFLGALVVMSTAYEVNNNHLTGQGGQVFSFTDTFFEASSAFGTVGLTNGLTPYLNPESLIAIILLMFIGQLGTNASILSFAKKANKKNKTALPIEDITVG